MLRGLPILQALTIAVLLASCTGSTRAIRNADTETVRLEILPFRLGQGLGADLVLHGDGRLEEERNGEILGTIRPDGRFIAVQRDTEYALQPDGSIVREDGTVLLVALSDDDCLRHRRLDREMRVRDDGRVVGIDATLPGARSEELLMRVSGDPDSIRRVALFTVAVVNDLVNR